jgi:hypothetical protein
MTPAEEMLAHVQELLAQAQAEMEEQAKSEPTPPLRVLFYGISNFTMVTGPGGTMRLEIGAGPSFVLATILHAEYVVEHS